MRLRNKCEQQFNASLSNIANGNAIFEGNILNFPSPICSIGINLYFEYWLFIVFQTTSGILLVITSYNYGLTYD